MLSQQSILSGDSKVSHSQMKKLPHHHLAIAYTFIHGIVISNILNRHYLYDLTNRVIPDIFLQLTAHLVN